MDDNVFQELQKILGIQNTVGALGIDRKTLQRYNADPSKMKHTFILACTYLKRILDNQEFLLKKYNLSEEKFIEQLTSDKHPNMTAKQFEQWMEKWGLSCSAAAEKLDLTTRTIQLYISGESPISRVVYLATEEYQFDNIDTLPGLVFSQKSKK